MLSKFKRVLQVGIKAENCLTSSPQFKAHSTSSSSEPINESAFTAQRESFTQAKEFSELVKSHGARVYRLDTCLLEKSLARAFPSNQAKAITSVYFEIWKDAVQRLDSNFARKEEVEKIQEMLRDIKNEARTRQEMRISWAFHKMEELNQALETLDAKVRDNLDKKAMEVKSNNQAKCASARHDMMLYYATVTVGLGAFFIAAGSFFK